MKRFTQSVCILLVMSMVLAIPAYAAGIQAAKGSSYFTMSSVYLEPISDTRFEVWFRVTATGTMDELGSSMIIVQRRASSSDEWENDRYYYPSTYTQMIDYDQITHAACVTYTGSDDYEYRAYVELYAKKGTGTAYMPEYAYF